MHLDTRASEGRKSVVILGGGFAGLAAAKSLARRREVEVFLFDQRNHHLFQPLLYQVATAGLNAADIAVPIRSQFSHAPNVEVHQARVDAVDLEKKKVIVGDNQLDFDYLVVALGAQHTYFGHKDWEEFAPGLKTVEQALEIRRRMLAAFEQAENEDDPALQRSLLTFVVVGGGPTGVEMAGAIADIAKTVLVKDFKRINPATTKVVLVEALPTILNTFTPELSQKAIQDLASLGVEVRTNSKVASISPQGVQLEGGEFIPTPNAIWAAGVQAAKLSFSPAIEMDRAGRVKVNKDFSIPNFENVFVIGDMASFTMEDGKPLPGLAPAAMQAGRFAAQNILNSIAGTTRTDFHYNDKGQMATIGKRKAIVQAGFLKMGGYFAWLAWFFIHVFYLVGFRNRISVMAQWAWSYLFSKRGARLITEKEWKLKA